MKIREVKIEDANNLMNLVLQVDNESEYMLYEPEERILTIDQQSNLIHKVITSTNQNIFIAENDSSEMIGYLAAQGNDFSKTKHKVFIVIGILDKYRGMGIGKSLFQKLEEWALENEIHRLELIVMSENKNAIRLYEKMGFEHEGFGKDVYRLKDGRYIDEIRMGKIVGSR